MTSNVGAADRIFRLILGAVLLLAPFISGMALFDSSLATGISIIAGVIMITTSAMRFCPLYRIFGIRTCRS